MKSRSFFAAIALPFALAACQSRESTTDDTDSTMMSQPDNTMNNNTMDDNTLNGDTGMGSTNMDTTFRDTGTTNTP